MSPPRVALVTGCAKEVGLGSAIARTLARQGMNLVLSDVEEGGRPNRANVASDVNDGWRGLDSLAEEVTGIGVEACTVVGDVSSEADVDRIVQTAVDRFGRLDVLVSNAAAPLRDESGQIDEVATSEWDRVMSVNAYGPFLLARAAVPVMKAGGWGRIVMISSLAGQLGLPNSAIYCMSKHAVVGLSRSLAVDLGPFGITVNSVCPGYTETTRAWAGARRTGYGDDIAGHLAEMAERLPVRRLGQPEDTAAMVGFVASEAAGFVTGQTLGVDGGVLPA